MNVRFEQATDAIQRIAFSCAGRQLINAGSGIARITPKKQNNKQKEKLTEAKETPQTASSGLTTALQAAQARKGGTLPDEFWRKLPVC